MKWIARAFVGGLFGFFGMYAILKMDLKMSLAPYALGVNVVLLVVGAGLVLAGMIFYYQIKHSVQKKVAGDEEDALEEWKYKKFADASLCFNSAYIVSFLFMCTSVLTDQPLWLISMSGLLLAVCFLLSFIMPKLMGLVYPDRPMPSAGDKDYGKKLLALSDDGERHVMLQGLYKSFNSVNGLLIFGMLLLLFYSIGTGSSQLFGITVIAAILLCSNIQYMWNIRGK